MGRECWSDFCASISSSPLMKPNLRYNNRFRFTCWPMEEIQKVSSEERSCSRAPQYRSEIFRTMNSTNLSRLSLQDPPSHGQKYYDVVVQQTGCSGSADTLECLRTVPYAKLKKAIDSSPSFFSYQVGH